MKNVAIWDVTQCGSSYKDDSKECIASIFRVKNQRTRNKLVVASNCVHSPKRRLFQELSSRTLHHVALVRTDVPKNLVPPSLGKKNQCSRNNVSPN
jgi:hypothetical protein